MSAEKPDRKLIDERRIEKLPGYADAADDLNGPFAGGRFGLGDG